jgi:Leucine-rich repeat (LRR) protein
MSGIPKFSYLDLSWNQLEGSIPTNRLASSITTVDLSHNFLNGTVPPNFSGLPDLQFLSVNGNHLNGSVPPAIWRNITFTGNRTLILDFQNNALDTIPVSFDPPEAVTVL